VRAIRLPGNPIITASTPGADPDMANNINGPSLIRVPAWVDQPLGKFYLYFAHHHGGHIRLAYADDLNGPWRIHEPGALHLPDSYFVNHIASPDVYVDHARQEIRLYYHGKLTEPEREQVTPEIDETFFYAQRSRMAISADGLHFTARPAIISSAYLRVFPFRGQFYGVTMPGLLYRSPDGLGAFERGPLLFGDDGNREANFFPPDQPSIRHLAALVIDDRLYIFYSRAGDEPECILMSAIDTSDADWHQWQPGPPQTILSPDELYEGHNLPLRPSTRGSDLTPVRELRDPAIFVDGDNIYLLYSIAGEQGIGIAELIIE
jgi:hypothetical protein